jgi:hypothetical protein
LDIVALFIPHMLPFCHGWCISFYCPTVFKLFFSSFPTYTKNITIHSQSLPFGLLGDPFCHSFVYCPITHLQLHPQPAHFKMSDLARYLGDVCYYRWEECCSDAQFPFGSENPELRFSGPGKTNMSALQFLSAL